MVISVYNLICNDGTRIILMIRLKDVLEKIAGFPQNKIRFHFHDNPDGEEAVTLTMKFSKDKKIGRETLDDLNRDLAMSAKIALDPDEPIVMDITSGNGIRKCVFQ